MKVEITWLDDFNSEQTAIDNEAKNIIDGSVNISFRYNIRITQIIKAEVVE
jgi:hypothetical protein